MKDPKNRVLGEIILSATRYANPDWDSSTDKHNLFAGCLTEILFLTGLVRRFLYGKLDCRQVYKLLPGSCYKPVVKVVQPSPPDGNTNQRGDGCFHHRMVTQIGSDKRTI
jgi:hypothetical protein